MADNNKNNENLDWDELFRTDRTGGRTGDDDSDIFTELFAGLETHHEPLIPPEEPEKPEVTEEPVPPPPPPETEPETAPEKPPVRRETPRPAAPPPPPPEAEEDMDDGFDDDEEAWEEERDYMPVKPSRTGRIGCLGGLMYAAFVISVSVILACVGWMFASDVLALNKPEVTGTVTLPKEIFTDKEIDVYDDEGNVIGTETVLSADMDYVAEQLKNAGMIEYEFLFKLYSAISDADTKIDPGTYELSTDFDYRALVKKMTTGSPSQMTTKLTFPEGYTMEQIFSLLEENDICSKEDLYDAAANYKFSYSFIDEELLGDASRLEGFLFPDTYDFYEGERASSVIGKFLYNFYTRYTAEMLEDTERRGMTVSQLVTVASMIEKESSASDEDRRNIASVIYNRLEAGMPLQIDATIQYFLPERVEVITNEHTSIESPYNTYLHTGLPPTPIANPGMAAINAALYPNDTSYLYYALDTETGTHRFFNTYAEQQAFVATQDYGS